jgi:hypothetical protein
MKQLILVPFRRDPRASREVTYGVGHFWYTSGPAHSQNASSKPQNPRRKMFAGTLTSWTVSNAADIPEPATLPLLAIGLLVPLALFRRGAPRRPS